MAGQYKQGRINETVKKELSFVLREIKDPRIPEFISVMHVNVSPDLKYAKAFVSVLGQYDEKELRRGLKAATGFIRKKLGERLQMRIVPEITFEIDKTVEIGSRIEQLLKDIQTEDHDE